MGRYRVMIQKLLEAWMDMRDDPQREGLRQQYAAGAGPFHDLVMHQAAAHVAAQGAMPPDMQVFVTHCINEYTRMLRDQHRDAVPFNENMLGLIMVIQADLTEPQRERLMSTMTMRNIDTGHFNVNHVRGVFLDLFCTPRNSLENPQLRASGRPFVFWMKDI